MTITRRVNLGETDPRIGRLRNRTKNRKRSLNKFGSIRK